MNAMTVDEVREQIAPLRDFRQTRLSREMAPEFLIEEGGIRLKLGLEEQRQTHVVSRELWEAVTRDLHAGSGYFMRTPPELLLPQINWWYGSDDPRAEKPDVMMLSKVRPDGKSMGIDLLKPTAFPVDADEVLGITHEVMAQGGDDPAYTFYERNGLKTVVLSVVKPNRAYEVQGRQVGDVLQGGVLLEFSPLGSHPFTVSTFTNRLICTNGMTDTVHLDRWKAPGGQGSEVPADWLPGAINEALTGIDAQFHAAQRLSEQEIPEESTEVIIEDVFSAFGVPAGLRNAVRRRLVAQNVSSMWDLLNAITHAATHDEQISDPRHRVRLMGVAGDLHEHSERCSACNHLLA